MRFYTKQHKFFCGIDLHARTMYLCILNEEGKIVLHRDIKTSPDIFLKTIAPYPSLELTGWRIMRKPDL